MNTSEFLRLFLMTKQGFLDMEPKLQALYTVECEINFT